MYNPSAIEKCNSQSQAFVDVSNICFLRELHHLIRFISDCVQKVYHSLFRKVQEMEASHSSCHNF
jgi:hypothetical protein